MAIARVGAWFNGQDKTSATFVDFTTTTAANAGDCLVMILATDNPGGNANPFSFAEINFSSSFQFQTAGSFVRSPGSAANDGSVVSIHYLILPSAIASGQTLRINFTTSVAAKAVSIDRFTGVTNVSTVVGSPVTQGGATSTPTVTKSITSGNLIVGAVAWETSTTTFTQDADATNGSWVGFARNGTSGGSSATNQQIGGASKIVSATGNQTYNPTITAVDNAIIVVELAAGPIVRQAQVQTADFDYGAFSMFAAPVTGLLTWSTDSPYTSAFPTSDGYWMFFSAYFLSLTGYRRWRLFHANDAETGFNWAGTLTQNTSLQTAPQDQDVVPLDGQRFGLPTRRLVSSGNPTHIYLQTVGHNAGTDTVSDSGFPTTLFTDPDVSGTQAYPTGSRLTDSKAIYACTGAPSSGAARVTKFRVAQHGTAPTTSFSLGTVEQSSWTGGVAAGVPGQLAVVGLSDTEFVAVAVTNQAVTDRLCARRFTVDSGSGTTITAAGTWDSITTQFVSFFRAEKLDANRVVVVWNSSATSAGNTADNKVYAVVLDTTGGTLTIGTPVEIEGSYTIAQAMPLILTVQDTDNVLVGIQHGSGAGGPSYWSVASGNTATTALSIARPSTTTAAEGLYAFIAIDADPGTITVTPDQAGWTELPESPIINAGNVGLHIFYKNGAQTAEPANYTFTLSANPGAAARGTIVRMFGGGFDLVDVWPHDVEVATGSGTSATLAAVESTNADTDKLAVAVVAAGSSVTSTPPSGHTERADGATGTVALSVSTQTSGAASDGAVAFTLSASAQWATAHFIAKGADGGVLFWELDCGVSGTSITIDRSKIVPNLARGTEKLGGSRYHFMEPSTTAPETYFGMSSGTDFQWVDLAEPGSPDATVSMVPVATTSAVGVSTVVAINPPAPPPPHWSTRYKHLLGR